MFVNTLSTKLKMFFPSFAAPPPTATSIFCNICWFYFVSLRSSVAFTLIAFCFTLILFFSVFSLCLIFRILQISFFSLFRFLVLVRPVPLDAMTTNLLFEFQFYFLSFYSFFLHFHSLFALAIPYIPVIIFSSLILSSAIFFAVFLFLSLIM